MPVVIKQRTISAVVDKRIQIDRDQIGRLVTLPSNWSKIRVGVRYQMLHVDAAIPYTPRLALGLGRGTTNMVGDAGCEHFVGMITTDPQMNWNGSNYSNVVFAPCTKVGATLTVGANGSGGGLVGGAETDSAKRLVMFCDITKGSPNFSIRPFFQFFIFDTDCSRETFLTQMAVDPPTVANCAYDGGAARTIAVDEGANGTLNAVQCWWNQGTNLLEICDLAVVVLS
jgi:hypothetical protein